MHRHGAPAVTNCQFIQQDSGQWKCSDCGHLTKRAYPNAPTRQCGVAKQQDQPPPPLTPTELTELFPNEDPTLLGNRIKAMTEAIGIPSCGGCEARKRWLNSAHAWIRSAVRS